VALLWELGQVVDAEMRDDAGEFEVREEFKEVEGC
jgi:hypothetical protein